MRTVKISWKNRVCPCNVIVKSHLISKLREFLTPFPHRKWCQWRMNPHPAIAFWTPLHVTCCSTASGPTPSPGNRSQTVPWSSLRWRFLAACPVTLWITIWESTVWTIPLGHFRSAFSLQFFFWCHESVGLPKDQYLWRILLLGAYNMEPQHWLTGDAYPEARGVLPYVQQCAEVRGHDTQA